MPPEMDPTSQSPDIPPLSEYLDLIESDVSFVVYILNLLLSLGYWTLLSFLTLNVFVMAVCVNWVGLKLFCNN